MTISTVAAVGHDNRLFFDNFKVAGTLTGEPLYEGFEGTLFPPEGWSSIHSSGTKYWERGTSGVIGTGAARHAFSNPGSTSLLVTPRLLPAYGQNLTYKVRTTSSSPAGTKLYIVLSTTTTDEAAFTEVLDSVPTIPTSWADKTVDLSGYTDQPIYIAFKAVDRYGCNLLIDEINGPNIDLSDQSCPKPTGLAMAQVEHNIATLTWQANGAERWVVEHSTTADFSAATSQMVTSATATISNLNPTTRYYVRVKADCYDGEYSPFAKADFTTSCAPITDSVWVESFANYSTTTMLPNCWTRSLSYGSSSSASYVYPNISTSANAKYDAVGAGMYFSHSVYVSPNTYTLIATPRFDYALQDRELAFYHKLNTTRQNPLFELVVGVMSDPSDPTTFVAVESISDTTRTWVGRYVSFESAPADYQYIAFKFQDLGDGSYQNSGVTMYIDNLELHRRPNCDMVTDFDVVANAEPRAVDITILPGAGETAWTIDYKIKGTTEWTSVEATSSNVTIRGLRDKKQYDIRVRAVCAADEVSNWLYGEFSTDCSYLPLTWSENFNTADTSNISTPACWSIYEGKYVYDATTIYPYANQGVIDGDTAYMHFRTNSSKQSIATPTFSDPLNNSQVEFKLKRSTMLIDSRFTVGAWVEGDSSTYVELLDVTPENTSWSDNTVILHSLTPLHNQLIFTVHNTVVNGYNIPAYYMDNVAIKPIAACPKPYNLKVDSLATNAAKISWTRAYQEAEWHVEYKLSSDSVWTALAPNPTTNPTALITGLQPGTNYDVRVQAVCRVGVSSDFVSSSFFTECVSTGELSENFDAVPTGSLPECWKGYSRTPASAFPKVEDASASNGVPTKAVKMIGGSPLFLISQKMSGDVSNYMVTFKLNKQSSGSAAIQVGYMTDPTDTATFVAVGTYDNGTNYKSYVTHYATFPANSGAECYVAFRHGAVAGYSYSDYSSNYIDDVVIDTVPTCIPLRGISLSNTDAYSTTLTIIANDAAQSNWEYAYTTDLAAAPADSLVRGTTTQLTTIVANLTPNTSYKFWARAACGTDRSTWSDAQTIKTACAASLNVGFTENFDNIAVDQLPDCWQRISTTSSPKVVAADTGNEVPTKAVKFQASKPQFLVLPEASVPLAALEVKFKLNKEGSTNKVQIGYLSDPTDQNTFVAVADLENTVNKTMVQYSVSFENVVDNGSNRYIAFRYGDVGSVSQSTFWYYWLDDIEIIASPHMKVNVWGVVKYDWLITPTLVIPQGENLGASLHFSLALTAEESAAAASTSGYDDKFMVAIATDNGTNWVDSIVWSNDTVNYHDYDFNTISTTAERIRINLTQYAGQNIRIGFYVESSVANASNDLHLDSILVRVDTIAPPTVVTQPATLVTYNSAKLNGVVTQGTYNIESEGFYYRVQTVGQWNYSSDGNLTGLSQGTTYEFYLFATANGVVYRGDTLTFTTEGQPAIHPVVTTVAADNITQTTATLHRTLVEDSSEPVTQKGWRYKKLSDADNAWLNTADSTLSNLMADTEYHFFAYATTALGTYRGDTLGFRTLAHVAPTVLTLPATNVTCTSAQLNKQVTAGSEVVQSQGWKFRRANDAGSPWYDADQSGTLGNLSQETEYVYFAYATTATFPMLTGDTLRFTTPPCTGVELAESSVSIYPNPAKDEVNILVDGLTTDATATIFDMQGRAVGKYTVAAATGKATVDVSTLADGTYVVRIVSKNINRVERLIIKR